MAERIVVSLHLRAAGSAESGYVRRSLAARKRAEALGAVLSAWGPDAFAFDFAPEEVEEAIDLARATFDDPSAVGPRFGAGVAFGELVRAGAAGSLAMLAWGEALSVAWKLATAAEPGEVLIDARCPVHLSEALRLRGERRLGPEALTALVLDTRHPFRRDTLVDSLGGVESKVRVTVPPLPSIQALSRELWERSAPPPSARERRPPSEPPPTDRSVAPPTIRNGPPSAVADDAAVVAGGVSPQAIVLPEASAPGEPFAVTEPSPPVASPPAALLALPSGVPAAAPSLTSVVGAPRSTPLPSAPSPSASPPPASSPPASSLASAVGAPRSTPLPSAPSPSASPPPAPPPPAPPLASAAGAPRSTPLPSAPSLSASPSAPSPSASAPSPSASEPAPAASEPAPSAPLSSEPAPSGERVAVVPPRPLPGVPPPRFPSAGTAPTVPPPGPAVRRITSSVPPLGAGRISWPGASEEYAELTAAARQALLKGNVAELERLSDELKSRGEADLAERMAGFVAWNRGAKAEGLRKLRVAADAETRPAHRVRALLAYGVALAASGRPDASLLAALGALARAREVADRQGEHVCARFLARLSAASGYEQAARTWAAVAEEIAAPRSA